MQSNLQSVNIGKDDEPLTKIFSQQFEKINVLPSEVDLAPSEAEPLASPLGSPIPPVSSNFTYRLSRRKMGFLAMSLGLIR